MKKPFLILQLREMDEPANDEFEDFLNYGGMEISEVKRVRLEKESISSLKPDDFTAIIVGGGPSNISDREEQKKDYQKRFESELNEFYNIIFEKDIPFMGSCYGFGSIAAYKGGEISKVKYSEEVGFVQLSLREEAKKDPLLINLPQSFFALCGHKEACQNLPKEAIWLVSSSNCPYQMLRFKENIYATQFHTELDSRGIAARINYYKNHGYFEPHMADELIEKTKSIDTNYAHEILRRFVKKYRK